MRTTPLTRLGFLTIGRFDPADPRPGHEQTLRLIEQAETLGFDTVWVRQRHLQAGISSPVAVMAAATQRTTRIQIGTAVIPLGLENPVRLAEDLATVDLLSGGRINAGVSVGVPHLYEHYKTKLYPGTHDVEDFSKDRVVRLLDCLRGEPVSDFEGTVGIDQFMHTVQPQSPGLADRVWYGAISKSSARWAGERGCNFLLSNLVSRDGTQGSDSAGIQAELIDEFRSKHPAPHRATVTMSLVVIPTDSASPAQVRKYRAYADARLDRTRASHGPRQVLFSPDLVGTCDELADQLQAHAGFQRADDAAFALPFDFEEDDYLQMTTDMAEKLGPKLGWTPSEVTSSAKR
ncbi:alkanesulfonate monooxygenase SsuD/methylene tetrahydromethanopterin reductase-like flavin-dependent oxidoreductase (luciferase family) [Mycobacterium sp. URHB0021]